MMWCMYTFANYNKTKKSNLSVQAKTTSIIPGGMIPPGPGPGYGLSVSLASPRENDLPPNRRRNDQGHQTSDPVDEATTTGATLGIYGSSIVVVVVVKFWPNDSCRRRRCCFCCYTVTHGVWLWVGSRREGVKWMGCCTGYKQHSVILGVEPIPQTVEWVCVSSSCGSLMDGIPLYPFWDPEP